MDDAKTWADEEFGGAELGDVRRTRALVRVAARVMEAPGGTVAGVCRSSSERQAAYDLMSNKAVRPEALLAATASATARRCAEHEYVYVPVDGSSLVLTDRAKNKPLGSIGKRSFPTRGLKAVNAVAVAPDGRLEGVLDVKFWVRGTRKSKQSRYHRRRSRNTEMRHWTAAVKSVSKVLKADAPEVQPWFVMDREADESALLRQLSKAGAWFTIRAAQDRVARWRNKPTKLFSAVGKAKPMGRRVLQVPRTPKRVARAAKVVIRATSLQVMLPTYTGKNERIATEVGVVEVREVGTMSNPIHWVLLTNRPVTMLEEADRVIDSYRARWRIEEFHRTWKSGACNVEDTQLRSREAVIRWASMLAVVAVRIERLKRLSREEPTRSAADELSDIEIEVLLLLKRREKKKTEQVPDAIPTLQQAVRWLADLGGYTGKSSGGPPGSITIQRGYDRVAISVQAILAWKDRNK